MYMHMPIVFGVIAYFGYLFSYGIMSITTGIYPEEIFPSSVRASGVGLASSISRIAAAIGTWGLKPLQDVIGTSGVLLVLAGVSALGGILSYAWAPETNGKSLTETSHEKDPHSYQRRRPRTAQPA
jgi:putative MFS transporter